jgi:hypothetical protein
MTKQHNHENMQIGSGEEPVFNSASLDKSTPDINTPPPHDNVLVQKDKGRKITFDNVDYHQDVHYMTEEHQNIDKHYVTAMATENRVSGKHLSDKPPADGILQMENGICLPSPLENTKQRDNYIILAERILATKVPCLSYLSDVTTPHIPHAYSKEMNEKTETVSEILVFKPIKIKIATVLQCVIVHINNACYCFYTGSCY